MSRPAKTLYNVGDTAQIRFGKSIVTVTGIVSRGPLYDILTVRRGTELVRTSSDCLRSVKAS